MEISDNADKILSQIFGIRIQNHSRKSYRLAGSGRGDTTNCTDASEHCDSHDVMMLMLFSTY